MDFLTTQDLYPTITPTDLNTLTGGDDDILIQAESVAIAEMKSYLNTRYDVDKLFDPDQGKKALIVSKLSAIIIYQLHKRISPNHIPEHRKEDYKEAIAWLEKCADGFISPDFPIPSTEGKTDDESQQTKPMWTSSTTKQNPYY